MNKCACWSIIITILGIILVSILIKRPEINGFIGLPILMSPIIQNQENIKEEISEYNTLTDWINELNWEIIDVPNNGHSLSHALLRSILQDNRHGRYPSYTTKFNKLRNIIRNYYLKNEEIEYDKCTFSDIKRNRNDYRIYFNKFADTHINQKQQTNYWASEDIVRIAAGIIKIKKIFILKVEDDIVLNFPGFKYVPDDLDGHGDYEYFDNHSVTYDEIINYFKIEKPIVLIHSDTNHYNAVYWKNTNIYEGLGDKKNIFSEIGIL